MINIGFRNLIYVVKNKVLDMLISWREVQNDKLILSFEKKMFQYRKTTYILECRWPYENSIFKFSFKIESPNKSYNLNKNYNDLLRKFIV